MNLLDKLLVDMEEDINSATPEIVMMALDLMEEKRAKMIEATRTDPSRAAVLRTYKSILDQYTMYKILWHRERRRHDWSYSRDSWQHIESSVCKSIKRFKADLLGALCRIQELIPGITYRELNRTSYEVLYSKWC